MSSGTQLRWAGLETGERPRVGGQAIDEPGADHDDQEHGDQGAQVLPHAQPVFDRIEGVCGSRGWAETAERRRRTERRCGSPPVARRAEWNDVS